MLRRAPERVILDRLQLIPPNNHTSITEGQKRNRSSVKPLPSTMFISSTVGESNVRLGRRGLDRLLGEIDVRCSVSLR